MPDGRKELACPECGATRWTLTLQESLTRVCYWTPDTGDGPAHEMVTDQRIEPSWWICASGHDASNDDGDLLTGWYNDHMGEGFS